MDSQEYAALQAINEHYENNSNIPNEDHLAKWMEIRPVQALELIDKLSSGGFIELMDVRKTSGFGSRHERSISGLTRKGEDALAHPEEY